MLGDGIPPTREDVLQLVRALVDVAREPELARGVDELDSAWAKPLQAEFATRPLAVFSRSCLHHLCTAQESNSSQARAACALVAAAEAARMLGACVRRLGPAAGPAGAQRTACSGW